MDTKTYVLREIQAEYEDIEASVEIVIDGYREFAANPGVLVQVELMHSELKDRIRRNRMAFLIAIKTYGGDQKEIALNKLVQKDS